MRVFVEGQELSERNPVPELANVKSSDEWLKAFLRWLTSKYGPDISFEIIVSTDTTSTDDANVLEMWVPTAPPLRAQEIGGFLKTCRGSSND